MTSYSDTYKWCKSLVLVGDIHPDINFEYIAPTLTLTQSKYTRLFPKNKDIRKTLGYVIWRNDWTISVHDFLVYVLLLQRYVILLNPRAWIKYTSNVPQSVRCTGICPMAVWWDATGKTLRKIEGIEFKCLICWYWNLSLIPVRYLNLCC